MKTFEENAAAWASSNSWLSGDPPFIHLKEIYGSPTQTDLWTPETEITPPGWIETSPSYLLLAADLLREGKLLSELEWRAFEKLLGELLESEGWKVQVTRATKDGGVDVIAEKLDNVLGAIRSLWQAKKYGPQRKVRLSEVRELSAICDAERATKAIVVTTSHLTRDAIEWVKRDVFRMDYRDKEYVENWVKRKAFGL